MSATATAAEPINELASRPPIGPGHNLPPLDQQLAEELAGKKLRAAELVEAATSSQIASDDQAGQVTTLIRLIRDEEKSLDQAREERKRPFLDAGRAVDAAYGAVIRPLVLARAGENGRGGLGAMLTQWENQREAEAQRERERLAAEQRQQEEEAERARQAAEAARAQGSGSVSAELAAIRAQEEADRLGRQAATVRPEPIRAALGTATMRREIAFDVVDIRKLLGWMLKQPLKGQVEQAARTIMGGYLKNLGVDAIDRGIAIPGIEARIEKRAQVR
jgi:hypothetical protein